MSKTLVTLAPHEADALILSFILPLSDNHSYRKAIRNHAIALLMLDAGLRVGEVTKLRIKDLVWENSPVNSLAITSDIAKGGRERYIPLTIRLDNAIRSMLTHIWKPNQDPPNAFAFYHKNSAFQLVPRQVQRIIKKAGRQALGRDIHPHVLRHTFATRLMRTTSIRVVQELLGHKQLTSTQIYTHPHLTDLADAIKTLNS